MTRRAAARAASRPASAAAIVLVGSGRVVSPVGHIGRPVHLGNRRRIVRHGGPVDDGELHAGPLAQLRHEPGRRLLAAVAVRGQDQPLLGPGHGHVEQPTLLVRVEVARGHGLAQELAREPAAALLADGPLPLQQVGDDDDRELQALRLVEGHEPHAVDVLGQLHAGRQLAAGGLVGVEVVHEVGQGLRPGSRPASRTRSA